jgi:hypothetical protein
MTVATPEQRNPYKGDSPRPWLRIRFVAADGSSHDRELVVDTGSPLAMIIDSDSLRRLLRREGPELESNFGPLQGGDVRFVIPELGTEHELTGYANDKVVTAVRTSSPDFGGLIGLSLLRLMEYGGDADEFWVRSAPGRP